MRNPEYWAERALNEMLMGERSVLEYEDALLQAYTIALREIKKDIDMAKLTTAAKKRIIQWIENLEDGDTIKLKDGVAYIYNESGCELDNTL